MIKVAFDISPLHSGHKARGMGFYTKHLLSILKQLPIVSIEEFMSVKEVGDADLVHIPYFDLFYPTLALKKAKPTVVTIGDVTPLVFPQHYPPGIKGKINYLRQKQSLKNVSAVITFSNHSKKDISEILGLNPEKIFPIYLAAAQHFRPIGDQNRLVQTKKEFNLPDRFALFVGSVNWNKNIVNLTQASINAQLDIVLIGKSFLTKDNLDHPEMKSLKEFKNKFSGNKKVHTLGFVEDEKLVDIYNLAEMLLLPSFYEGFGLPVLEAQACGTPVITSNISSLPEITENSALLIDPYDIQGITNAIEKILNDSAFRMDLSIKGLNNVKRFSWQKCANETVDVYTKILL